MLISADQHNAISRLNQEPISKQAEALLPLDWVNSNSLHLMSLAWWGILERGIYRRAEGNLQALERATDPARVFRVLVGESENDVALTELPPDPALAAQRVLENVLEM